RIIGFRRGTGGSSGVGFLKQALDLTFSPELFELRTEIGPAAGFAVRKLCAGSGYSGGPAGGCSPARQASMPDEPRRPSMACFPHPPAGTPHRPFVVATSSLSATRSATVGYTIDAAVTKPRADASQWRLLPRLRRKRSIA